MHTVSTMGATCTSRQQKLQWGYSKLRIFMESKSLLTFREMTIARSAPPCSTYRHSAEATRLCSDSLKQPDQLVGRLWNKVPIDRLPTHSERLGDGLNGVLPSVMHLPGDLDLVGSHGRGTTTNTAPCSLHLITLDT